MIIDQGYVYLFPGLATVTSPYDPIQACKKVLLVVFKVNV